MAQDWSRYWRAADPLEAMYAHFEQHVYHRHSHDCYSFGVTEDGAQAFRCRGARHTSAAGMVMAFNPDDPHDGHAADELGFTYRIVHIGTELVASVLAEITGGPLESGQASLPLFAEPVLDDVVLARSLGALHRGLLGGASALRRDELLAAAIASMARRASTSGAVGSGPRRAAGGVSAGSVSAGAVSAGAVSAGAVSAGIGAADRARQFIHAAVGADVTAGQLAAAAGCSSRFALHRAFVSAYGMTPADYQRQLRLRAARTLIAAGRPISEAAAASGFADQSHLTRWFARCYGITPGEYRRAGCPVVSQTEVRPTVVRHTGSGNR